MLLVSTLAGRNLGDPSGAKASLRAEPSCPHAELLSTDPPRKGTGLAPTSQTCLSQQPGPSRRDKLGHSPPTCGRSSSLCRTRAPSRLPLRALTAPAKGSQGEEDQGVRAPHGGQDHPAPQLLLRRERWSWEGKRTGGARDPRSPAEPGGQRLWLHPLGGRGGEGAGPCGSLRTDWGLPAFLERRLQDSACVLRPAGETEADACTEALHSQGSGWAPGRRSPDFACRLNAGLRRSLGNDLESGSLGFAERGAARIGGG